MRRGTLTQGQLAAWFCLDTFGHSDHYKSMKRSNVAKNFGRNATKLIKSRQESLRTVCRETGISLGGLQRILSGDMPTGPSIRSADAIARYFGRSIDEMCRRTLP